MVEIIDFTDYPQKFERTYGGASGRKYDIDYNGEPWFLKFPSNIGDQVKDMSYSNGAVSEYIGSKIYESIGIETHETKLGIYGAKCVVACKDLVRDDEFPITGFGEFKTTFVPTFCDSRGNETNGNGTDLEEIIKTLKEHPKLRKYPELEERFWDMFVVDALIGNNDRNNGNWGMIKNINGSYRMSPVFDNGAAFYPKSSEEKIKKVLNDEVLYRNSMYSGCICIFSLQGHTINPLKYIEKGENQDCNEAVKRIVPKVNLEKVQEIINEIPETYAGVEIITDNTKKLYSKLFQDRYEKVLVPVLEKIIENDKEIESVREQNAMEACMKRTAARTAERKLDKKLDR